MSGPAYLSDPQVQHLTQVLDEIAKGHIQIPTFQRRFLWTDEKRLDLLDSIRKGIPIGSILIWRTNLALGGKLPERVVRLGPHVLPPPSASQSSRSYLLDGMQRLSTLYGCLRPLPPGASPFVEDEDGVPQSWLVCFDLEKETFEIAQGEPLPATLLPLTALLDSVRLIQFTRGLAQRPDADVLIRRADALAETFRNYKLPIIPVASDSLAEATLTFQRVNSQGTRMSELHMVRALTWSESFDLEEQLEQAQSYLAQVGWEALEPELILKACKAALGLDVLVEVPQELSEGLKRNPGLIKEVTNNIWRVARWLGALGIRSPRNVPYSAQIVLLAEAARNNPSIAPAIQGRLWRWFWHTTYAGYFTGISGYRMQTLLEGVRALAVGESMQWPNKREPPVDFELPKRFDARAARVKATAWLLANQKPLSEGKELIDALGQLATRGPAAMVPIIPFESEIPGERGIANRTFMSEGGDIRPALLERPHSLAPEVLRSHALSPEAAEALAARDYPRFLQLRKAYIEDLERQFFESLPKW